MNRLLTLTRAGLRSNFGLAVLRHRLFKEKKDRWLVPLFGVAALAVLPSIYGLFLLVQNIYLALKPLGQERALLTLGILGGQLFILLFGLYYVISAFYFSRDLEFLIPLPLKPFEVIASKFAVILVNEYLTVMVIVLPVLVGYGVIARSRPDYWVNGVLVYLLLPVIPLAVVSILVVALMRVVNISRKKDALILVGSVLLIAVGMGLQFLLGRPGRGQLSGQAMTGFFTSPNSLLNLIGTRFPPSIWATKAIAGGFSASGLLNLALFAGASIFLFAAILVLSEKLFYRGLVGLGEVSGRRRSLSRAQMSQRVSSGRHPVRAIFVREWRIMNRTPIFLLNGTLVVLIVPVVFILMATAGSGRGDAGSILKVMTSAQPLFVILASAAFMIVCGSLNGTSSSTFSREGGQFWISRVIPVAPRDQVAAKFLHSYLVSLLGTVTASAAAVGILHLNVAHLAAAAGLSLVAGVLLTAVGMMIDLARPLLDWSNPQKAIKQNLNVLLAMCADIGILTALFFGIRFQVRAGFSNAAILVSLYAALAALSWLSYAALVKFAGKRYREIEV
jgi:ABC-2 type transport system permease protein